MRTIIAAFVLSLLLIGSVSAQDVSKLRVKRVAVAKVVKPDTCLGVSADGVTLYRGKFGGVYYWDTARGGKNAGQLVKRYIKR